MAMKVSFSKDSQVLIGEHCHQSQQKSVETGGWNSPGTVSAIQTR